MKRLYDDDDVRGGAAEHGPKLRDSAENWLVQQAQYDRAQVPAERLKLKRLVVLQPVSISMIERDDISKMLAV